MGCFNVEISQHSNLSNTTVEKQGYTSKLNIYVDRTIPKYSIEYTPTKVSTNIGIVCDINYGEPLYASDGNLFTIDGKVIYVRRLRV